MNTIDLPALLRETEAVIEGHFRLSSGLHSPKYVQCARLLEHPRNARAVGEALAAELRPFQPDRVIAPAMGGLIIGYAVAEALGVPMIFTERKDGAMQIRRGFRIGNERRAVIVEDVVTTGKSTREATAAAEAAGAEIVAIGSILDRSGKDNPFQLPHRSLMSLAINTWAPEECPLCAAGAPLDAPGSRFSEKP